MVARIYKWKKMQMARNMRGVVAIMAAVFLTAALPGLLRAQNWGEHGFPRELDNPAEVPDSTNESPQDIGIRAHSNHLIMVRPERVQQFGSQIPFGETPGSLGCIYQTSSASLSSGCPITGNLASGNNGLPNPSGGSQAIAIVDAYDYPTAYNDLSVFSSQFELPVLQPCSATLTSGCFEQVYASGSRPAANGSWALEAALDIEWAHAMAPAAKIVLVEAASDSFANLFQAVSVASGIVAQSGGSGEVSMSWGGSEFYGEGSYDSYLQTPGVVYLAAAGDTGGYTIYPSVSPFVVSAGGTTVNRNVAGDFVSETAWSGGGGGPSAYEAAPAYQAPIVNLVGKRRGTPDFAFDANPNTGVFVYDSTPYDRSSGWWLVGGTSVATPSLAGIINLAGTFSYNSAAELKKIYGVCGNGPSTNCVGANFRDITSGFAGRFNAATGWDFTTGVGSNQGLHGK
jgi:subtilase family serine protease